MSNDDWRDYVPPTDRGVGEAALPRGVGRRPSSSEPAAPDATAPAAARGSARPVHRGQGSARIKSSVCYVDAEGTCVIEEREGLAIGVVTKGKKGNIIKPGWTRFHSKREAKRYVYLLGRQRHGLIRGLRRQVKFGLMVQRPDKLLEQIATWACDFEYEELLGEPVDGRWQRVVEDCKGMRTEIYQRSKKHFEAQYGITITET